MFFRFSFYLFFSVVICTTAFSESHSKTVSFEVLSKLTAVCKNTILKNKNNVTDIHLQHCASLLSGKTFFFETNWYANQFNVSFDVSKYRGKVMTDAGELLTLIQKDKAHHAGFYYAHQPDFSINVLVKNHPDISKIKQFYKDKSWSHFVNIREVKFSWDELSRVQQETTKTFHRLKISNMSSIDEQKNHVSVQVENIEDALLKLKQNNTQLHESVKLVKGQTYVCTLIGCSNRTKVHLSEILKPDNYLFKITFDNKETKFYRISVTNNLTDECKKSKSPPPIIAIDSNRWPMNLYVDSRVCKDKKSYRAKSVAPFRSFSVDHKPNPLDKTDDPINIKLEIVNSKGQSILIKNKNIHFDIKSKSQPNGKRCGPICFKGSVNL